MNVHPAVALMGRLADQLGADVAALRENERRALVVTGPS
jgi:hypothetical protein